LATNVEFSYQSRNSDIVSFTVKTQFRATITVAVASLVSFKRIFHHSIDPLIEVPNDKLN